VTLRYLPATWCSSPTGGGALAVSFRSLDSVLDMAVRAV
jgi:hypothetical protein